VPTSIDASGRKLLSDSTVPGPYLPVAGGTMQGPVALAGNTTAITPAPGDNDTSVATTAFVNTHVTNVLGGSGFAPIASPVLTGDPKAPTPALGDADTSIATTKFVADTLSSTLSALPPPGATMAPGTPTVPTPLPGQLWFDTVGGQLYVRYDDGTSQQWVPATNIAGLANAATKQDVAAAMGNVGRNLIHNPLFNIAQRGAGPWTTLGTYTSDRWFMNGSADAISFSVALASDTDRTQIGDETAGLVLQNVFTGNAGAAAYNFAVQYIESARRLCGNTVTVSFWAKASVGTPKLGANIYQSFGTGGSPSTGGWVSATGQAVQLTGTFTRYALTFTIPSASGKTFGTAANDSHGLTFFFSSGSTNNAAAGNIGVQSGTVRIWGVQLEIGNVATPLEKPDPRYDLSNCQRFYQIGQQQQQMQSQGAATTYTTIFPLPVTMRATPTIIGNFTTQIGGTGSVAGIGSTTAGTGVQFNIAISGATGNAVNVFGTWTASADL